MNRPVRLPSALLFAVAALWFAPPHGSAQTAGPNARPLKYEIWAELDHPARRLHGRETIEWTNLSAEPVPDMAIHLYWNAFKNERSAMLREYEDEGSGLRPIRLDRGDPWGWIDIRQLTLEGGADLRPGMSFEAVDGNDAPEDQTVARVRFPRPVLPGETVRLVLRFEARIPRVMRRAGFAGDAYFFGQWFPKPGVYEAGKGWNCHQYHQNSEFFADFADFTVHLTVPDRFVVGASGRETAVAHDPGRGTTTRTFRQSRIHDFAWAASPRFVRSERTFDPGQEVTAGELAGLARTFRCRPEELRLRPVRMIVLLCREHAGQENRHFRALAAGLKYFGLWYGAYPYDTVTLIDPPYGADVGGMEYPTLFTAGTSLFPGEGTHDPETVIVHEFGHGYWYGMVGSNEFEDPWLDEGINTYSTGKVLEKAYGPARIPFRPGGLPLSRYLRGLTYQDADLDRLAGIQAVPWDAVTTWAWKFSSSMSYGLNVYSRAATLLSTLEHLLGEEVMMRVLRTYFQRFRFGHPRHADFVAVAEEVSGRPLGWFFRSLFEDTLVFDYAVTDLHSTQAETPRGVFERDGRKWTVTATEAEKRDRARQGAPYRTLVRVRRLGPARIGGDARLQIRVAFADGRQKSVFWDGQAAWAEFSFQEPSPALRADIDPDGIYPIDANRSNNGRTVSPRAAPSLRWTGRIQFWLQNLFHLVGFFS